MEVTCRELDGMEEMNAAAEMLASIWGYPPGQLPVTPEMLRALAHAGDYVAGVFVDGTLAGASAAFFGQHDGELILHSHITGVMGARQGAHLGYALKQHQRAWALERSVAAIEWTFDPLVRRNAYFNLMKLGAEIVRYEPDFYGPMRDATNAGDESDRVVTRWNLLTDAGAADSKRSVDDGAGAVAILSPSSTGAPEVVESDAPLLRVWVPDRYTEERDRLQPWRRAVRAALGGALDRGYVAVGMSRDGWYTLVRT